MVEHKDALDTYYLGIGMHPAPICICIFIFYSIL